MNSTRALHSTALQNVGSNKTNMYDDGVHNDFEHAHQTGLRRGFDLGWSYKGRFDRSILRSMIEDMDPKRDRVKIKVLMTCIETLKTHENNREFITDNL